MPDLHHCPKCCGAGMPRWALNRKGVEAYVCVACGILFAAAMPGGVPMSRPTQPSDGLSLVGRRTCGCIAIAAHCAQDDPEYLRVQWAIRRDHLRQERITPEAVRAASWQCAKCQPKQEAMEI